MAIKYPSKDGNNKKRRAVAQWIEEQCESYRDGTLSKEQIRKLESLPGWSWNLDLGEPDHHGQE